MLSLDSQVNKIQLQFTLRLNGHVMFYIFGMATQDTP